MKKVVYVLGAGFSEPLGLPVMANFLSKAKNMFAEEPKTYGYFGDVFKMLKEKLSFAKNYYETDLFNIEEVLSILEMKYYLYKNGEQGQFIKLIQDVITHHTPDLESFPGRDEPQHRFLLGLPGGRCWLPYYSFVASLCNLVVKVTDKHGRLSSSCSVLENGAEYSLITLNYDLIVESVLDRLKGIGAKVQLKVGLEEDESIDSDQFYLAKLHGSVEPHGSDKTPIIVPPTWSKGSNEAVRPAWRLAFNLLRNANYVRVLGYSLPESDAYVRYLFKSAILDCENLEGFDVITRDDSNGDTKKRYDDFLSFTGYKFLSYDLKAYLDGAGGQSPKTTPETGVHIEYNRLETVHKRGMRGELPIIGS